MPLDDPWIAPPEPADDVVIYPATEDMPAFTWGDHRQMSKWLEEAEENDPAVKAARIRLDEALGVGLKEIIPICKECHKPQNKPHDEECSYRPARPEEIPKRDAHGYAFLDENMVEIHHSAVCCNDEEAIDYFRIVRQMIWTTEHKVKFVTKRALGENDYKLMPYWYEWETGKVWHFDQRKPV